MKPTDKEILDAFENTVDAIGMDMAQCLQEAGEEPIVDRDTVVDYLPIHGNDGGLGRSRSTIGNRVFEALIRNEITDEDLDRAGVPRQWVL